MHLSTSAVLLFVATGFAGANNKNSSLEEAFKNFMLVPLLFDHVPQSKVSVRFSSDIVNLGNKIPAYSASFPPYIYYEADPKCLYTVMMSGVDGECAGVPKNSEFLIALLVNTPGNNLEKSTYLTPYCISNTAPPGSGYHRIVILVFEQTKKIDTTTPYMQNLHRNNTRFSTRNFAATYGLEKLLGGNFFLMQKTICPDDQEIAYTCNLS